MLMRKLLAVQRYECRDGENIYGRRCTYEEWYTTVEVQVDQSDASVTPASTPTLPTGLSLANSPSAYQWRQVLDRYL